MNNGIQYFLICILIASCTPQKTVLFADNTQLKFVNEYDVSYNKSFQNTTIGGLSGIDYDAKHDVYYLISDDRSAMNPARFYKAKIHIDQNKIDRVEFTGVKTLLQSDGTVYPNSKQDPYHTPDPEDIRYNAKTKQLVWTSEGERIVKKQGVVLEDPSVIAVTTGGKYIDSFALPSNMHMQSIEKGPRQNGVFEGLSFANHYKHLFVSVEEPLYEDGPRAGLDDSSAWIRIVKYDVKTRKPIAQYGYQIDPVAYPANPPGAFKINGIPDILVLNDHQLIVIERSFSSGRKPCTIKIYLADLNGAEDVSSISSLKNTSFHPVAKRLLLNMDSLGIYTDNIEGVTFGPRLSNGHQSLVFVADNNFSPDEITQFLLFQIL